MVESRRVLWVDDGRYDILGAQRTIVEAWFRGKQVDIDSYGGLGDYDDVAMNDIATRLKKGKHSLLVIVCKEMDFLFKLAEKVGIDIFFPRFAESSRDESDVIVGASRKIEYYKFEGFTWLLFKNGRTICEEICVQQGYIRGKSRRKK